MAAQAFQQWPGSIALGFGVGQAIGPLIAPLLEDLRHEAWQSHDVRALSPELAARLVASGMWSQAQGEAEARLNGINVERFDRLVAEARTGPAIGELLELSRRDLISDDQLDRGFMQAGLRPEWWPMLRSLRRNLLSANELAQMVIRTVITPQQGRDRAAALGLDAEQFDQLVAVTGNPPGPETLLQMWNRNLVDEGEVDKGLRQGNLKPEWYPSFKQLREAIPTLSDMIRFAVREVYNPEQRAALGLDGDFPDDFAADAALHGYSLERAKQSWAAHWQLPSPTQGYTMLWRGLITPQQLDGLLKALDYSPTWRERLAKISHHVPGRIDLRRMLRFGLITRADVKRGYIRLGYEDADAEAMTKLAEYEATHSETTSPLVSRARSRLYTVAHAEYLDGSLTEQDARQVLAQLGATAGEADTIIALWAREDEIARTELTAAQVKKALKKQLMSREEAVARLVDRGYTADDAAILLDE